MEKFTKGPWIAEDGDRFSKEVVITNCERADNCTVPICEMDVYFDGVVGDEQYANAALIAAAPEMYEMLKAIYLESLHDGETVFAQNINLILKKARGNDDEITKNSFSYG